MIEGKPLLRRVAAVGMALLLVGAGVSLSPAGPAVGTASAEWVDCDLTDPLLGAAYNTIIGADSGCRWSAGTQTDVENLTATDAYANSLALKDSAESYTTSVSNYQEDSRTVAYSKAKIEMVNELNNGSSASVAKGAVNNTVEDYYSRQQAEIIKDWNAKVTQLSYLNNTSVGMRAHFDSGSSEFQDPDIEFDPGYIVNFTLANNSVIEVKYIGYTGPGIRIAPVAATSAETYYLADIETQDPSDSSWTAVIDSSNYGMVEQGGTFDSRTDRSYYGKLNILGAPATQSTQVKANMAPYVDEVYAQYAVGELNSTDLATIDPGVIGQEASTSLNSTGYYGHAAIMLASIGAGGDVNVSHNLTVIGDTSNTTLDGTLFYSGDDAPATGWNTSQVYNMTNYNGTFYMAVAKDDGNATIADLEDYGEEFVINEATNTKTGETVNTTKVETYTYDSTNASALEEELDRLRTLRQEYENQLATGGGGGWFGDLGGTQIGIIIALVGVIALLTRD